MAVLQPCRTTGRRPSLQSAACFYKKVPAGMSVDWCGRSGTGADVEGNGPGPTRFTSARLRSGHDGDQIAKNLPFEPPTDLAVYTGKMTDRLDVDKSVQNLFYFLNACVREMELVTITAGKVALGDLNRDDLVTLDPFLARALKIDLGYVAPENQAAYFSEFPIPGAFQTNSEEAAVH